MTWQITLSHVCAVLYDISLLARAFRCMQMFLQTLLFKSAAWHGTFDMIISHLSDLTSPSSDTRCQPRWAMMATLNTNLDRLRGKMPKQWKDDSMEMLFNKGLSISVGCAFTFLLAIKALFTHRLMFWQIYIFPLYYYLSLFLSTQPNQDLSINTPHFTRWW